ncbi:Ig-like domain-containing protein [Cohnella panacarvi]|uniref:Ig-like domain-containing protein n=1 Tax=Cohnella panacarvi TaxID=400776 RepID=UPI00047CCA6D|nr:Ig-like domain-containing protein [Cohnella panacarvi]
MNMRNETTRRQSWTWRLCAAVIAIALTIVPWSSVSAAEETVLGVELDSVSEPVAVIVEGEPYSIRAWATVSTTSNKKDVSDSATWTSSSSLIKVNKGVITATGEVSSATITVKYSGFTDEVKVKSVYQYKEVKLELEGADAPATKTVQLGNELILKANGVKDDSSVDNVTEAATWTSSNTAVATVDDGKVTLVSAGKATIIAKRLGRSDTIELTVESPYSAIKIYSDPVIDGPIEMYVGDNDRILVAKAVPKSGGAEATITEDATWTSSNSNVVKVEDGKVTAVGAGTAVVTAKQHGVSESVTFYVRTAFEAMKLLPDKPIAVTLYGAGVELEASVVKGTSPADDVTGEAEWKTGDAFIATIVKSGDKVTVVPRSVGSTKVSATYKGLTKEQTITVYPSIVSVDIAKDELDVFVEDTASLPAVSGGTAAGGSQDISKLVQWTSSDSAVVAIEDGKWKALKTGTATLTAKVENEAGVPGAVKTDTITVNVHNKVLTLDSDITAISVVTGKEANLPPVKIIYENGNEEVITDKITWKVSSPNLLVKAPKIKGLKASTVTLTGSYLSKTITFKVTIEEEFTSFQITPTGGLQLTLNKSQSIKVTGLTKSGKKVSLASRLDWQASEPDLVSINKSSIKGLKEGSGKLTAVIQGKTLEVSYKVTAKLTKLAASVKSIKQVAIGTTETVKLTADFENGKSNDVTAEAKWTTSNARVATVTNGIIKFVGKGSASIKASYGGKTVTVSVSAK